jgi:hypothetical protein
MDGTSFRSGADHILSYRRRATAVPRWRLQMHTPVLRTRLLQGAIWNSKRFKVMPVQLSTHISAGYAENLQMRAPIFQDALASPFTMPTRPPTVVSLFQDTHQTGALMHERASACAISQSDLVVDYSVTTCSSIGHAPSQFFLGPPQRGSSRNVQRADSTPCIASASSRSAPRLLTHIVTDRTDFDTIRVGAPSAHESSLTTLTPGASPEWIP